MHTDLFQNAPKSSFMACAFSSQTQNTTFWKKLRFISNQMGFLYLPFQNVLFQLKKLKQTGTKYVNNLIFLRGLVSKLTLKPNLNIRKK